ncbi:hypothetical protein LTR22_026741 [Elasticomyces elasticus]|nr:hypothetical protein LTR22_026741 [Elasticomyces elasticus]KAK4910366.1 hypothetical protein LTR49_020973 [Elasticomyces elasticus]KAK5740856.1 hypothetical protein LTS12_024805 [Elasticomyces elasticus]
MPDLPRSVVIKFIRYPKATFASDTRSYVQIVDVAEEARVKGYFDLAEDSESRADRPIIPGHDQNFWRDTSEYLENRLGSLVMQTYECEDLTRALRPAIMFRLCLQDCNAFHLDLGASGVCARVCMEEFRTSTVPGTIQQE